MIRQGWTKMKTGGRVRTKIHRGVEQLAARWAHNPKVAGSSPAPATKVKRLNRKVQPLYFKSI